VNTKIVLLDMTKSSATEDFTANVKAIERVINALPDNGHIVVVGISDAFGRPRMLLDRRIRGTSVLALQAAKELATADWRKIAAALAPQYDNTSLLGTLELLPYLIEASSYDLLILSDGRENVRVNIDRVAQIDTPRLLKNLQGKKAIPSLSSVRVYMLGVTPNGKTAEYFRSLRAFWEAYFTAAGARLEAFRIDRTLPF
jgi:hypothetical protein